MAVYGLFAEYGAEPAAEAVLCFDCVRYGLVGLLEKGGYFFKWFVFVPYKNIVFVVEVVVFNGSISGDKLFIEFECIKHAKREAFVFADDEID